MKKYLFSTCIILFLFSSLITSCSKQPYSIEEAEESLKNAQKVNVTILVKEIEPKSSDMGGFVVSSLQDVDVVVSGTTTKEGWVSLKLSKGTAIVMVEKAGYNIEHQQIIVSDLSTGTRNDSVIVYVSLVE